MTPDDMRLEPATEAHLRALREWFPDESAVRLWAGPWFTYPFTAGSFRADVRWGEMDSLVLLSADDAMLAFGQVYQKAGRAHLARLAVAPGLRGRGIGRRLIEALVALGCTRFACREASLFVYRDNPPAMACYQRLGFVESPYPPGEKIDPDIVFMVLPDRGARRVSVRRFEAS